MSLAKAIAALRARTFFVPETLQTSMMDCGPATLKSLFDGHRRPINFERLRERCQTDVDGTSLAAMRDVAERLGLDVDTVMVPKDHLLVEEAQCLPAIVVLVNPDGQLHFVVAWSQIGAWIQVMDPASGRRWIHRTRFLEDVAVKRLELPEERWREWASGDDFRLPLGARLRSLGIGAAQAEALIARAEADPSPWSHAALDAATRFTASMVEAEALPPGGAALAFLQRAFETDCASAKPSIPNPYWTCRPGKTPGKVASTGALLITVAGIREEEVEEAATSAPAPSGELPVPTSATRIPLPPASARGTAFRSTAIRSTALRLSMTPDGVSGSRRLFATRLARGAPDAGASMWAGPVVPTPVMDELRSDTVRPHRVFMRLLWEDSRVAVLLVTGIVALGAVTGVIDALMMRGLSDLLGNMNLVAHRVVAIAAVATFLAVALTLDLSQAHLVQRLARGLELRLRVAFLEKLPKLEDAYFRSRPASDLASRAHLLQTLRGVPRLAVDALTGVLRLTATAGVLVWLEPRLWKLAAALLVVSVAVPLVSYKLLDEAMARVRVLGGNLYRFYLDALLGVVPIRVHGGERSVRREHEAILTEWVRSALSVEGRAVAIRAVQRLFGTAMAVAIVVLFVTRGGDIRALLLIAFFAQRLPSEAESLVTVMRRYPLLRHDAMRLFEPLASTERGGDSAPRARPLAQARGVELTFSDVTAVAGGQSVLEGVDLRIRPGEHVAIVGPSGAGKSSLVSVLLGWLHVAEGRVLVDRRPLDAQRLVQLREETAWVDPAVQLWNATLIENMLYGHGDEALADIEPTLAASDLLDVVERMPDGLQSPLGESGARISGGQGQRVRVARALLARHPRLVILDEPFRGLERKKRREMLARAREKWADATLLFVSHDVGDTLDMDRVVVVEGGELVEDGTPAELLDAGGTYADLVEGDREALEGVWGRPEWRRVYVEDGSLRTAGEDGAPDDAAEAG